MSCNAFGALRFLSIGAAVLASSHGISPHSAWAGEGQFDVNGGSSSLPVHGVVRASQQATITTDLMARVSSIGFKEGQRFNKGDTLITFDCRRQLAELAAATAQKKEMEVAYQSALILEKRSAGSRQDIEVSHARLERASAEADGMRAKIDQCEIKAPYDGRVVDLQIQAHEMPIAGKPIISIVADGNAEIELIVPSSWLIWIRVGADFTFFAEETRRSYPAKIMRVGAAVDAVSQTIKIYGGFASAPDVLPGMSGAADFLKLRN
jgi:RND family efflux transporter MFP subunit